MKKKHLLLSALLLLSLTIYLSSCGGSSDDAQPTTSDLGTFLGEVQVSDDPLTKLGYITGSKVSVSRKGADVTVKITGTPSLDREYTGTMIAESAQTKSYSVSFKQQTKPATKNAAGNLVISGNSLGFDIDLLSDAVNAIDGTQTISITGKLKLLGSNLVRQ